MGGASSVHSQAKGTGRGAATTGQVPRLGAQPPRQQGGVTLFDAIPVDDSVKLKSPTVLLEVGEQGFRVLRPTTEDALALFPWGQIHSWAHGPERFSFRFFEESSKKIVKYSFHVKHVDQLMQAIQHVIDTILGERRSQAISKEEFDKLVQYLHATDPPERLVGVQSAAAMNFFTSQQGNALVSLCHEAFDKVEAAATLHPRLVDQNHFALVLEALECPEDKENVWHRLSAFKKQKSIASRKPSC